MKFFLFLLAHCSATWYFKEAKICDPKQDNVIPFTGFKISRIYKINGLPMPMSMSFLSITHCDHGKVDYEKFIPTANLREVNWERPFCVLKPKSGSYPLNRQESVQKEKQNETTETANEVETSLLSKSKIKKVALGIGHLIRTKIDEGIEKFTDGGLLDYTGKASHNHLLDMKGADPQSSLAWEARHLACFKMARRRKYARRDITFYMPLTFVGALFDCPIPKEKRRQIFNDFKTDDFMKQLDFKCDPSIAKPLLPLIADDITKLWLESQFGHRMNPALVQTTPFLSTSTPLNLRFATSDTPDMFSDTWATKIDVNEDYDYSEIELNMLSQALAASSNYLHKIISPPNINHLTNPSNFGLIGDDFTESPNASKELIIQNFNKMPWEQKLSLMFSKYDEVEAFSHLKKLQKYWDIIK